MEGGQIYLFSLVLKYFIAPHWISGKFPHSPPKGDSPKRNPTVSPGVGLAPRWCHCVHHSPPGNIVAVNPDEGPEAPASDS